MRRSAVISSFSIGLMLAFLVGCSYNDFPKITDCAASTLSVTLVNKNNPSTCKSIDGNITISASGGVSPYTYSLNNSSFQLSGTFTSLGPGDYVAIVLDANNCQRNIRVSLISPDSNLAANVAVTNDSNCLSANGSITVTVTNGKPPYIYQLNNGTFDNQNLFKNLVAGVYTVTVIDGSGCPTSIGVVIPRDKTGVSYVANIKPILDQNCNFQGCHNGDLGGARDWRDYDNVKTNAQNIKLRTSNKSMPPGGYSLTPDQIQLISCWVGDGAINN